jgi:hypothetical protein
MKPYDILQEEMIECRLTSEIAEDYVSKIVALIMSAQMQSNVMGFELVNTIFPVHYTSLRLWRQRILQEWFVQAATGGPWKQSQLGDTWFGLYHSVDKDIFRNLEPHKMNWFKIEAYISMPAVLEKKRLTFADIVDPRYSWSLSIAKLRLKTDDVDVQIIYENIKMLDCFDIIFARYLKERMNG